MSHFTRLKTEIVEKDLLLAALEDLGYDPAEGDLQISGYESQKTRAEVCVQVSGGEIGFRKEEDTYECVADWWGIKGVRRSDFMNQLSQRYAYHTTREKLQEQGFSLVEEEEEDNRIRLTMRRAT